MNSKHIVFLFRENNPGEIPQNMLEDQDYIFIHEEPSFKDYAFPPGRSTSFESFAGLNGMMKSVWNQVEWLKRWGSIPLRDGKSFRQSYFYRDLPLWYFAELFIHYPKKLLRIITLIDTFHRLTENYEIDSITVINEKLPLSSVLIKCCELKEITVQVLKGTRSYGLKARIKQNLINMTTRITAELYVIKMFLSIVYINLVRPLIRKRINMHINSGKKQLDKEIKKICVISHGSYWRSAPAGYEGKSRQMDMYWDRLLDELNDESVEKNTAVTILGVGPRSIHRRRTKFTKFREFFLPLGEDLPYVTIKWFTSFSAWLRTWRGHRMIMKQRRNFLTDINFLESIVYKGINFSEEMYTDFKQMFLLMLPWAIKIIEQSLSAFEKLKPDVVCLYAEAGGYGRAVAYAARLAGIPTLAIQHGLIFPHNYTYVHTKEEIEGKDETPYPYTDRFLLYDSFVKDLLIKYGNYPPQTLFVTGGHKMDNLIRLREQTDPKEIKKTLGFDDRDHFAVIASRFSEIGSAFPEIVRAVESIPRMHLIVKPHQAELPEYYTDIAESLGAHKIRVVSNKENLFNLMLACDMLITVNSLAALEALVLQKPVIVVNLPNHLSVYVDAGIAVGVENHREILPAIQKVLREEQDELLKQQEKFSEMYTFKTDGLSGERIKAEIYSFCFRERGGK